MNSLLQSLIRPAFGLLLFAGVATGAVATTARPAEAGVVVSIGVGFGGGYHHYYRHGGYYGYRHYGPAVWVAPVYYRPRPAYFYPGPHAFGRPYYYSHYYHGYGYGYGHGYGYGYGHGYGRGYGGHRFYR